MSNVGHRIISKGLTEGHDLDLITQQGFYDAIAPTNGPESGNFYIMVFRSFENTGNFNNTKQIAFNYANGNMWTRKHTGVAYEPSWTQMNTGGGGSMTGAAIVSALNTELGSPYSWQNSPSVYNVLDYPGVDPTGVADSRAGIQAALDDCKNAGGGVVYVPKGTYKLSYAGSASLGGVRIGDNTVFMGEGKDVTIIKMADIGNNDVAGVVRTYSGVENTNIVVRDMTIDGNKQGQTGWANVICFFAGVTPADRVHMDRDIWCINVTCRNGKNGTTGSSNLSRGYGFDPHEVVDRFHAINCLAHDNERDGFVLDGVTNFKILGCQSYANGRYGINIITESFNGVISGNHVYGNGSNNIMVQGDSHHVLVSDNFVKDAGEQGIRVRRGGVIVDTYVTIRGNTVIASARNGVNITGANYNTVSDNLIINSSQSSNNTYFDVSVDQDDGDTTVFTGAFFNVVKNNYAVAEAAATNKAKAAYREDLTGASPANNFYLWNIASGQVQGSYSTISTTSKVYNSATPTYYNALDYGVKGDGTTNDTPAARALIDLIAAAGGGVAYFPARTYVFEGTGTASQGCIALPSNVTILGDGKGRTIFKAIGNAARTVDITGLVRLKSGAANIDVSVVGITIDGNSGAQGGSTANVSCFYTGGTGDADITLVDVEARNGYNGTGSAGYGFRFKDTGSNFTILTCEATNCQDGFLFDGVSKAKARNCRSYSNLRNAWNVTNGSFGIDITDCDGEASPTNNLIVQVDSYDVSVNGGRWTGASTEGIRIRRGATVVDTRFRITNALIANNQRDGLKLSGCSNNLVLGNMFRDNGLQTNNLYGDVTLVQDTTTAGSTTSNNVIAHNIALATAANKTKYGFQEVATAGDTNDFTYNYGTGQTTALYLITGASSKTVSSSGGAGTPGGTDSQFQFNGTGSFAGAAGFTYDLANVRAQAVNPLELKTPGSPPSAAPTDSNLIYTLKRGNIPLVASVDQFSRRTFLGKHLGFQTFGTIMGGASAIAANGLALTTSGTGATPSYATATKAQSTKRTAISTTAAAAQACGVRVSSNCLVRGAAAGIGGYLVTIVFSLGVHDGTNTRGFFGVSSADVAAASNPSTTALAVFGVGFDAGATNFRFISNPAAGTATYTDLGANFPVAVNTLYELVIFCKPNDANMYYSLTNLETGNNATGTINTNLPASGSFLGPQALTNTGAGTTAITLDLGAVYVESANY